MADQHKSLWHPQNLALQIDFDFCRHAESQTKVSHLAAEIENAVEDGLKVFADLHSQPRSVIADLHLIRLATLRPITGVIDQAEQIAAYWLDPIRGVERFDCFRAVLNLIDGHFWCWPDSRNLPAWLRLACVWYHASRIHGILLPKDAELQRLTAWLTRNTDAWTSEILARESASWSDVSRARCVTYGNSVLHAFAYLLSETITSAQGLAIPDKLKAFVEQDPQRALLLRFDLARRCDLSSNMLNSFLGCATIAEGSAVFGVEFSNLFLLPSDDDLVARLEALAAAPNNFLNWAILRGLIGEGEFPSHLRPRLIETLRTVDFAAMAEIDPNMLGLALSFSTQQARASGDEGLMHRLEEAIMGLAHFESDRPSDQSTIFPLWQALADALLPLAVVPGDEDASARRCFDLFRRFAERCPAFAAGVSSAPMHWVKKLPFAQQVNLWPFILTLRAVR